MLVALACLVAVLTVVPGAPRFSGARVHLALLAAYLLLAVSP